MFERRPRNYSVYYAEMSEVVFLKWTRFSVPELLYVLLKMSANNIRNGILKLNSINRGRRSKCYQLQVAGRKLIVDDQWYFTLYVLYSSFNIRNRVGCHVQNSFEIKMTLIITDISYFLFEEFYIT